MFFNQENINQRVRELKNSNQELVEQLSSLFEELKIKPEELENYMNNPDNFSNEEKEIIEMQQKHLDDRLDQSLKNIPNPKKTEKRYNKLRKRAHWMPV